MPPRLGGQKLIALVQSFGSIDAVFDASDEQLRHAGLQTDCIRYLRRPDQDELGSDLTWLEQAAHDLIPFDDPRFPVLLTEINTPPAALFTDGDADILWNPQLAVVGSRNPTAGGIENARDFSQTMARHGFTITSGLAMGIDGAAHRAAIDTGSFTVAVLGSGLDRIYPAANRGLADAVRRNGVLVSEFPPNTSA